jgi:hypothetical protein
MTCVTVSLASATPKVAPSLRRAANTRRGGSVVVRGKKAAFFKEFDEQYQKDNEVKEKKEDSALMAGFPGLASECPARARRIMRRRTRRRGRDNTTAPMKRKISVHRPRAMPRAFFARPSRSLEALSISRDESRRRLSSP